LIKTSNDSYFDVLAIHNVSFTPQYKRVKTLRIEKETHNNLKAPNLC